LWPDTTKRSSTEQISAQLSKFQAYSSAKNTFSSNFAKNRSFDKCGSWHISEVDNWEWFFAIFGLSGHKGMGKTCAPIKIEEKV
jgi:hypothetical protein